jgi:tetratricopeptide (TPR) repeat protein
MSLLCWVRLAWAGASKRLFDVGLSLGAEGAIVKVRGYIRVVVICILTAWAGNSHLASAQTDEATALELRVRELRKEGKTEEALPLARQALALREQALTPGHADVNRSLKSLAELYEVQGRYAEAEPLYKRSAEPPGFGRSRP